jgi:hypothetical protein
LGARVAVRATIAYKGFWVRRTVSLTRLGELPESWADAAARFRDGAEELSAGRDLTAKMAGFQHWSAVGPFGGHPLADLIDSNAAHRTIRPGSIINLGVRVDTIDGPWLGAGPVLLASEEGRPAQPLFA